MAAKKKSWKDKAEELRSRALVAVMVWSFTLSDSEAIERVSKEYNGRKLPEGKKLRLSASTLKRLYYQWKANPTDAVFRLNYAEGHQSSLSLWQIELIEFYAIQNGCSLRELHERLSALDPAFPVSRAGLYRNMPEASKARISKALTLLRRKATIEAELIELTKKERV
jgi:hypothetical protein